MIEQGRIRSILKISRPPSRSFVKRAADRASRDALHRECRPSALTVNDCRSAGRGGRVVCAQRLANATKFIAVALSTARKLDLSLYRHEVRLHHRFWADQHYLRRSEWYAARRTTISGSVGIKCRQCMAGASGCSTHPDQRHAGGNLAESVLRGQRVPYKSPALIERRHHCVSTQQG